MKRLLIVLAAASTAGLAQAEYYVHPETKTIRALQKDIADAKAKRNKLAKDQGYKLQDISEMDAAVEEAGMKQAATKEETKAPAERSRDEIIEAIKAGNEDVTDNEVLSVMERPIVVPKKLQQNYQSYTNQLDRDQKSIEFYKDCIKDNKFNVFQKKRDQELYCFPDEAPEQK